MPVKQPEFKPVAEMSYSDAVKELDSILQMMQGNDCDIDNLTAYTKRCAELLRECRSRLTATDQQLKEILDELEK